MIGVESRKGVRNSRKRGLDLGRIEPDVGIVRAAGRTDLLCDRKAVAGGVERQTLLEGR